MPRPPRQPANDIAPPKRAAEALRPDDLAHEFGMKQAEERIAAAKGEHAAGARWMLRRLRQRIFSGR